jgi:uncharacterized protein YdhG (YjbR/CyaY superfamily)
LSAEVDAYLAALTPANRAVLQALRAVLKARLPDHLEVISYAMPGFRQPGPKGRMVAGYASFRHHCGYYPHSGNIVPQFASETAGFKTSKSGVLFTPHHPLPDDLVLKLVAARIAEISRLGR